MSLNFDEYFQEYEKLVAGIDAVFSSVVGKFPEQVMCRTGCSSCCHALFDLFLVEALYINRKFTELPKERQVEILKRADFADRKSYKLKRDLAKRARSGENQSELLQYAAELRVRCPLLDDDQRCALYNFRPLTCRLYGIPVSIEGSSHTCGLSAFKTGGAYPTVQLEKIQGRLQQISFALAEGLGSRYSELGRMLVPVSTALLTEYTPEYLGLVEEQNQAQSVSGLGE